ncbi:MAG TPA: tetratricopeptide repeat protein [Tissierellaceae bacterium]
MKLLSTLIAILICLIVPVYVKAEHTFETNYIYDCWGFPQKSIPAFELVDIIDRSDTGNIPLMSLDDVYVSNGKIYLIDSVESRLNIFDEGKNLLASIKVIRNEENKIVVDPETNTQLILKNPEGVFVKEDTGEIYIADTGGERIIVLDNQKYYLKKIIERPSNMVGVTVFRPSKIVVDNAGRIYAVVQGGREGIIELNSDGSFSRYFGVNKPRTSIIEYFWKNLASEVQKEKIRKVYAPSFNNIDIDQEGFIYATTSDSAAVHKVFRLNAKGENVLRRADKIVGDLIHTEDQTPSMFVDIAVSDFGAYALLDKANGRIFIYSFDGDLLNIFGGLGYSKGSFQEPTSIAWDGRTLIVTDKKLVKAFIFHPTRFGEVALGAVESYYHGRWEEAAELFEKALAMNSNYDVAYVGIGRNLLMQDRYEEAMYYLKLGNDKEYYSKAYSGYRNLIIQENFIWFVTLFLIFVVYIIYSECQHIKNVRKLENTR